MALKTAHMRKWRIRGPQKTASFWGGSGSGSPENRKIFRVIRREGFETCAKTKYIF